MIERDPDEDYEWLVTCDYCDDSVEAITAKHFMRVIEHIHSIGWIIVKVEDEWKHKCDNCIRTNIKGLIRTVRTIKEY